MKLTVKQVEKIKEKYKGYQVFNNKNIVGGDPILVDCEMPFVKVCYDYNYIELYDKDDFDIENFEKYFEWGEFI